jgi:hypothetical protein
MVLRGTARAAFDAAEQDETASVVSGSSFEM